jgi:hypothetical protein
VTRRIPTRIAAVWLLLFFLLLQGADGFGLHRCPMHEAATAAGAHSLHTGHGAAASHEGGHGKQENVPCTCMGMCCMSATGVLPPTASVTLQPVLTSVATASVESSSALLSLRRPYLLPYGQAPPLLG